MEYSNQQQDTFYMHQPIAGIAHAMAFVTPVVDHWMEHT